MISASTAAALLAASSLAVQRVNGAKLAQSFEAPTSDWYAGPSNGSLPVESVVPGLAFDRFIQIWFENTDFAAAASNPKFAELASKGLLLTQYNSITHPSEPEYIASITGDFFGLPDDDVYYLPSNVSTIVDLLEAKNVSWATYQEFMPTDGYQGADFTQTNVYNASEGDYTYYKRKHNPFIIANSVANVTERMKRIRNYNDFAADLNASAIPSYVYFTPGMTNDGHDTSLDFLGDYVDWWLTPLLNDTRFNDNRTLILVTFDENEDYASQNTVYSVLLGGALPNSSIGQTDPTYYTHYSALSTVEYNWQLGNLGRGDTNKTMSNVFSPFASAFNYTNNGLSLTNNSGIPLTNLTGIFPGALNTEMWQPVPAPVDMPGAGGGATFFAPGVNKNMTWANLPAPVNLTGGTNPQMVNPGIPDLIATSNASSTSNTTTTTTSGTSGADAGRTLSLAALGASAFAAAAFVL